MKMLTYLAIYPPMDFISIAFFYSFEEDKNLFIEKNT